MGAARLCVLLTVLVTVKMVASKPTFGTQIWCDLFCDDDYYDDDDSESSSGLEAMIDSALGCGGCSTGSKKPSKSKTTTASPAMHQPFDIVIAPTNGVNLTMTNTGSSWLMNFKPWVGQPGAATTAASATTTAAPATTAAGTTKAGGTTAAPTTAAP